MAGEKNYENKIKAFLDKRGCWYVKFFANAYTKRGVPDILACVNGYFVAIEVKSARGKPSELQVWNRDKIRSCGGISIILYPDRFEEFKELIDGLMHDERVDQYQFDIT